MAYNKDLVAFLVEKINARKSTNIKPVSPTYTVDDYVEHSLLDPSVISFQEATMLLEDYVKEVIGEYKTKSMTEMGKFETRMIVSYGNAMMVVIILNCFHPSYNGYTEVCVIHNVYGQ